MCALRYRVAALYATALAVMVGMSGCDWRPNQPAPAAGSVAVIDLNAVAQRLGSDKKIAEAINQRQTALNGRLVELAQNYNAQLAERKKALAETASQDSEVTLASWQREANANLNQLKRQAAADLSSHRQRLVIEFREQIKPAARRVAARRGLSVIVTNNDSVIFDFTGAVDITEEVIAELTARNSP